ncbi:energy-coupled thiamine transporter ThiT [Enterococcus timonensis]|uniref:energy-coupled thiamine transporter ThiT n=1 Tax=Enterococcus timonensis TaxID=1852364 RepID=UPI0008D9C6C7|nr:energy-coupled thiamine transporter ThiT [Enterococcus timonensis]
MQKQKLVVWVEVAVIAALCYVLGLIPIESANAAFDLSLGLIPLVIFSLRRGAGPAMLAGVLWGTLSILTGKAYIVTVPQVIFEYPFAFAFGGLGGIFSIKVKQAISNDGKNKNLWLVLTALVAVFSRWFWHFWAGVFIWGSYAPEGQSPFVYSLIANGGSAIANSVLLIVVLLLISQTGRSFKRLILA